MEGPIQNIPADQIEAYRAQQEKELIEASRPTGLIITEQEDSDGGPFPAPTKVFFKEKEIYEAVVLEVTKKHALLVLALTR